jgi:16S rRNA (guanine527-N7)-methyltransferase
MQYFDQQTPHFLALGFRQEALPGLKKYIDLLVASNEELNLISRKMTFEELIDNHVIDCMLALSSFPKDLKVIADLGSGGGLPGVLLALQFPTTQFHLYEKSPLKREFLAKCQKLCPNVELHDQISSEMKNTDLITARAFKGTDVILDMTRKYYASGGRYLLLKGRKEKIDEELGLAQKSFKDLKSKIVQLKSPVMDVERHLVMIN